MNMCHVIVQFILIYFYKYQNIKLKIKYLLSNKSQFLTIYHLNA
jgi:hypothetical protein